MTLKVRIVQLSGHLLTQMQRERLHPMCKRYCKSTQAERLIKTHTRPSLKLHIVMSVAFVLCH